MHEGKGEGLEGIGVRRRPTVCAQCCSVPCSMLLCARTSRGSQQPRASQAPSHKVREYGMRLAGLSRQGPEAGQNQNGLEYFFSLAFGQQGWEQNSPVGWSCYWKIPTSLFSCVLCAWPSFRSEGGSRALFARGPLRQCPCPLCLQAPGSGLAYL